MLLRIAPPFCSLMGRKRLCADVSLQCHTPLCTGPNSQFRQSTPGHTAGDGHGQGEGPGAIPNCSGRNGRCMTMSESSTRKYSSVGFTILNHCARTQDLL